MKILFISNLYPPNVIGGYERLCFDMASALHARGHDITVLTSSYGGGHEEIRGQRVIRTLKLFATEGAIYKPFEASLEERGQWERHNEEQFCKLVEEAEPDLLFVWNLYFFNHGFLDLIQQSALPKLYLLTDNWMLLFLNPEFIGKYFSREVFKKKVITRIINRMLPGGLKKKSSNTVMSIKGRAIFASKFMMHLYEDASCAFQEGSAICYHGVHFLHKPEAQRKDRTTFVKEGEVRLLFAGRIVDIKGVHTALEALAGIQRACRQQRVTLTIVGDTQDKSYKKRLDDLAARLGLEQSLIFRQPVPETGLFDLFQQFDIYLFPSLYEPFSLTLILALEAGIPTVASAAGGNVEIVGHRQTGLLFEAGNAGSLKRQVVEMIRNDQLRAQLSRAATGRASAFTFEKMVSQIETELEQTLCV
ncbi:glycosyltransferase family 4 protein [Pelodictyon phaeoclathratiforme]|jgi:glycosyltransferase involved in cell wall biosynthesis|uniref:Glycosyl transferase group 1 n=1 Tax=Pelodictyon phaeoclathratiforme (strain DSM 5477 / BU-1) TaxID=324925 RepID=B4SFT2_PELPB|nr:glycosyltransferase family 4 protein [Pelodictyon phaeoclathratiforme]ACF44759.1 glycosyl transferase group 1 [Pelodictyon phaeoclathratiforme BU-1]MBV5289822.1 glycosyltransferase family 4 protein [Pelodictyon phaeoclathratiforme]